MVGGATPGEVTEEVRRVLAEVKAEFEAQAQASGRTGEIPMFEPVAAMTQVVAGLNYFVKVRLAENEFAFLRIYDRFGDISLTSFQLGKDVSDELAYF